jgi:hypothetical protein
MKKLTKQDIPQGFNWASVDSDGKAFAFKEKPIQCKNEWVGQCSTYFMGYGFDNTDWQNSIISIFDYEKAN